ncbi:hypothetical protein DFH28DRAFT_1068366 [Melampsora americana]|nr:hypothetical protein DFH28DRAFT_1068366 [Melampsora americana]
MPTLNSSSTHQNQIEKPNTQVPSSLNTPNDLNQSHSNHLDGPSNRVDLINSEHGRILCIADLRGRISQINQLANEFNAIAVIHSGDFGFYEPTSLERISDRTLRHLIQYSSLITPQFRSQLLAPNMNVHSIRQMILSPPNPSINIPTGDPSGVGSPPAFPLSEFPDLLSGKLKLNVPVYTVWGACEDVAILEKIRAAGPSHLKVPNSNTTKTLDSKTSLSPYSIPNLTVLDEATTRCLVIGGVRLRLFGLGGAIVPHKLFDNGEGGATIAGGQGTMWTSVLQIGEVVDTAQRVYDPTETRLLISHASPGREGLLSQLALVLKADLSISAGLHFRYGVSYNEFSVQHDQEAFRGKLHHAKSTFTEIWDTVKGQVEAVIDEHQRQLLSNALAVANRVPAPPLPGGGAPTEEPAWKNSWNWNLPDAAFGSLILDIKEGRIGAEMRSQGFNFAYRAASQQKPTSASTTGPNSTVPVTNPPSAVSNPHSQTTQSPVTHLPNQTHSRKPGSEGQNHSTRNQSPSVKAETSQDDHAPPSTSHSHHSSVTGGPKSHLTQGSGSSSNAASSGPRANSSQPFHRSMKSRDDPTSTHSSRPSVTSSAGAANTSKHDTHDTKNDSIKKSSNMTHNSTTTNGVSPKPVLQANIPNHPKITTSNDSKEIESGNSTPSGISPVASRKSSFPNSRKKKGSLPTSGANSVKSDTERSVPDKNDNAGPTSGGTNDKTGNNDAKPKGDPSTGANNEKPSKPTNNHQPGETGQNTSNNNNGAGGETNGNQGNFKPNYPTGSMRGRGGPNQRNGRGGGRGGRGGRGGFDGPRPSGPGLVGAALAGAGIGSNNRSASNSNQPSSGQ